MLICIRKYDGELFSVKESKQCKRKERNRDFDEKNYIITHIFPPFLPKSWLHSSKEP